MNEELELARYRFRGTWRGRWTGYLTIVVLMGLMGGLAIGAVAGARKTQSSYPTYLASTNPSDLAMVTAVLNPAIGNGSGYDAVVDRALARVPSVTGVAAAAGLNISPLRPDDAPIGNAYLPVSPGNALGFVNDEGLRVDRFTIVEGRMPNPARVNEFVTLPATAAAFGFHVGQVIRLGIYTNAQTELSDFGTPAVHPYRQMDMKLVGLGVLPTSLVEDDVDQTAELGYFTPALTRELLHCCANYSVASVQISDPRRNLETVESDISRVLPTGLPSTLSTPVQNTLAKAERAIRPESIGLAVFGGIVGLATLLIVGQLLGRQLRLRSGELSVLRALGANPAMTMSDGLLGTLGAVLVGGLLAVGVAVALSPLTPLGPVGQEYPQQGLSFDWTVLVAGFAVLFVCFTALTVVLAYYGAPHRVARRAERSPERSSGAARQAGALGLPLSAVTGIRFALEPGSGRNSVPVRSVILGAALAVVVMTTTVIFGASLNSLVQTPSLYGWNWTYMLSAGGGGGDIPARPAAQLLGRDHSVAAWSGAYFVTTKIDGLAVPSLGEVQGASVQPPLLSGHALTAKNQVVLGALTLGQLHKRLGDTVRVSRSTGTPVTLRIVGTATMPTIGESGEAHLEMGTGALFSSDLIPPVDRNPFNDPLTGPEDIFVTIRSGVDPSVALHSLQQMTGRLSNPANFGVAVLSVQRPAEIVNYRALGTTPAILAAALGTGVVAGLTLTLFASVRRRRHDLALLKTLGFSRTQLAATVRWQSIIAVTIGTAIGIPLGIVAGRTLWTFFAGDINAVPAPVVPAFTVILIAVGALLLATLVALLPGRMAARTPTALLLQTE